MTDAGLRALWRANGGSFHGPNVETGTMPEAKLLPFLRSLIEKPAIRHCINDPRECPTCDGNCDAHKP